MSRSLPAVYARTLLDLAAAGGLVEAPVLAAAGTTREALDTPGARITCAMYTSLLQQALELLDDPALLLRLGALTRVTVHGNLGLAALSAATLGDAFALFERFGATRFGGLRLAVGTIADEARVTLIEDAPLGALRDEIVVAAIAHLTTIAASLTGRTLSALVELAVPEPGYFAEHAAILQGTWTFGHEVSQIIMPRAAFAWPLALADATAFQLAHAQCEREARREST